MTRTDQLLACLSTSVRLGGGIHSASELAFMLGKRNTPAFTKFLADGVKKGVLRRVAKGLYESRITPPDPLTALYKIINKLRLGQLTYISLESQLSTLGEISQLPMGRETVMTNGRSGLFVTPYGEIEFIHTKKPVSEIMPQLYLDTEKHIYRANKALALADLKACRRNLQMLED